MFYWINKTEFNVINVPVFYLKIILKNIQHYFTLFILLLIHLTSNTHKTIKHELTDKLKPWWVNIRNKSLMQTVLMYSNIFKNSETKITCYMVIVIITFNTFSHKREAHILWNKMKISRFMEKRWFITNLTYIK